MESQPHKVGTNDTTVPLLTPIPMSFDIFDPYMSSTNLSLVWIAKLVTTLVHAMPTYFSGEEITAERIVKKWSPLINPDC